MRRIAVILGIALLIPVASPPFARSPSPPSQLASPPPLTFQAALDLALQNNAGLAAAKRAKAVREAAIISAKQLPNPEFSFEITRDTPHETVGFGLPFELGGKRARRIDLAREEQSLADLEVRGALQSLRGELRRSFYGLLAAEERVRLADEVAAIARRVRETAQARFDEGVAPRLDVLEAELGLARASADLELERSNRTGAAAALNAVLNRPPGQPVAVSGDISSGPPPLDAARAWVLAAAANIEIVALHREIAIEGRRAGLLRAERIPTPVLQGGAVLNAPGEFNSGAFAGLSVDIPLFSRNQGEIAQSTATTRQLEARLEAALRSVESLVFGATAKLDTLRRQVAAYAKTLVPTAISIESLAEESYKLGRTPLLTVLEAQRTLRDVRREYLQALADFQSAVAELEEIIGEPIQDK
jgi:cobalt-zinc-cadmium efflux system outer membrane protein